MSTSKPEKASKQIRFLSLTAPRLIAIGAIILCIFVFSWLIQVMENSPESEAPEQQQELAKFGFTKIQRQAIYNEVIAAERRAWDEARQQFPSDVMAQVDLDNELNEKYQNEIAEKYGISRDNLWSIVLEGVENNWPRPSR